MRRVFSFCSCREILKWTEHLRICCLESQKVGNFFSKVNINLDETGFLFSFFFFFWKSSVTKKGFGKGVLLQSRDSLPMFSHCWSLMSGRKLKPVRCGDIISTRLWGLSSSTKFARFKDDTRNPVCFILSTSLFLRKCTHKAAENHSIC